MTHLLGYWHTVLWTSVRENKGKHGTLTLGEVFPIVFFNQFVITLGCLFFIDYNDFYPLDKGLDIWTGVFEDNGIVQRLWRFVGMVLVMNIAFFILHIGCHQLKFMYRNVHYIHHEMKVPTGAGAVFCHPIEQIIVNIGPVGLAIWLFGAHDWYLVHSFVLFVSIETVLGHDRERSRHYYHHKKGKCNYGNSMYFEDKVGGTFRDWTDGNVENNVEDNVDDNVDYNVDYNVEGMEVRGFGIRGKRKASPSTRICL